MGAVSAGILVATSSAGETEEGDAFVVLVSATEGFSACANVVHGRDSSKRAAAKRMRDRQTMRVAVIIRGSRSGMRNTV